MSETDTVRENRIALIRALESGEYQKTTGNLSLRISSDTVAHCCIGVQRRIATGQEYISDDKINYELFKEDVDVSDNVKIYLIGMNDGGGVEIDTGLEYPNAVKRVRYTDKTREFPFIARFLRKLWRMSNV